MDDIFDLFEIRGDYGSYSGTFVKASSYDEAVKYLAESEYAEGLIDRGDYDTTDPTDLQIQQQIRKHEYRIGFFRWVPRCEDNEYCYSELVETRKGPGAFYGVWFDSQLQKDINND